MHNTKVSLDLASDEVTRIAVRSAFLELAAGATGDGGEAEVVSKPAPQTPPPTHAGGQDDGSYTNSLKLIRMELAKLGSKFGMRSWRIYFMSY